ncbi:YfcL family protein [Colwellia sp. E150_009]|jgi:hypothetical protein
MLKKLSTLNEVYHYLDSLFEQNVDSDTLFASGYLRGFISLAANDGDDEQQVISAPLIECVSNKLAGAKTELSPQDNVIVQNFWLSLQQKIQ